MSASLKRAWTRDEFFAWAEAQEERYEFDGDEPVLMTGGTFNHSPIHGNILAALRTALRGGPFLAVGPDAGVATIGAKVRYPDVVVTGTRPAGTARLVSEPLVAFEVISLMSGKMDRITKVREYAAVPSIRCYTVVESTSVGLTVLSRKTAGDPWISTPLADDDVLSVDHLNVALPVATIYAGVEFEA